jgi:molecular chaperone GrpE
VLDDFERALKVETADKEYERGIQLIYQRFFDALKKMGLEPVEAAGNGSTPITTKQCSGSTPTKPRTKQCSKSFQRGYNFKGKLLRPAWVKVAVKS